MKQEVIKIIKGSKQFMVKHARTILSVGSVIGVGASMYASGKAALAIKEKMDDFREENDRNPDVKETFHLIWKDCAKPLGAFAATTAVIVCNDRLNAKREKALRAIAIMATKAADDVIEKTVEKVTPKKLEEIKEAVTQKHVDELGDVPDGEIYETGYGSTLFLDRSTGRLFKSDMQEVRRAINDMVEMMNSGDGRITLNDWYTALHIPPTDIGDDIGYSRDIDGRFDNDIVDMEPVIDARERVVTEIWFCMPPKEIWALDRNY